MEYTLKEEILDKLEQIEESIAIIQQRIKGYQTVDDCLMSMLGMTVLDACILRIQVIGETIKSIVISQHLPALSDQIIEIKADLK